LYVDAVPRIEASWAARLAAWDASVRAIAAGEQTNMIAAPQITALKRTTILDTPDWGAPAAPTWYQVIGVTMRLRANNLLIAVSKLIWTTNLRMCANNLLILDKHSRSGTFVCTNGIRLGKRWLRRKHAQLMSAFGGKADIGVWLKDICS
jgi:hypothetical protein